MTGLAPSRPTLVEERRLWDSGHRWVAGLDEVGRGAWAGPVSVGVAVLCTGATAEGMPAWLRDSKLLAEARRELVFDEVAGWCADGAVGHATAAECDRWGMSAALRLAAYRALAALELRPDALLVDGPRDLLAPGPDPGPASARRSGPGDDLLPPTPRSGLGADDSPLGRRSGSRADLAAAARRAGPARGGEPAPPSLLPLPPVAHPRTVAPVVGGDRRCASVAAASVLAKVVRDRLMREEAQHFPAYHFERNKGYPSVAHRTALRGYGLSAIHRRSWSYVADLPWR